MASRSDVFDESANVVGSLRFAFAGPGALQGAASFRTGCRSRARPLKISVVIPSWGDAQNLHRLLPKLSSVHEVIVVEAERDPEFSAANNVTLLHCDVPSRGKQMNDGARIATGDVLVFLHADAELRSTHLEAITRAMENTEIIGGAFYRQFDERHPHLRRFEGVARFLTRNDGTLFGDQTVFVRRNAFRQLGGFAEIPLMEDVEFSRRLRAAGRVVILDPPIRTSARRHLEHGAWRTTIRNGAFLLLFKLGVSAETLHAVYYARRNQTSAPPQLDPAPAVQPKQ